MSGHCHGGSGFPSLSQASWTMRAGHSLVFTAARRTYACNAQRLRRLSHQRQRLSEMFVIDAVPL